MKPRFTPALESYEANTAKGLCAYCGRALDAFSKGLHVNGKLNRLHEGCWKAIVVAERLRPTFSASLSSAIQSLTASSVPKYRIAEDQIIRAVLQGREYTQNRQAP